MTISKDSTPGLARVELKHDLDTVLKRLQHLIDTEDRYQSLFDENPRPIWLKWVTPGALLMGKVNAAYTRATGITVRAYSGETDKTLWGDDQTFNEADKEVINTRMRVKIAERANNPLTHKPEVWVGWKWPYIVRGKVVGIWGEAIPVPVEVYDEFRDLIDYVVYKT